MSVVAVITGIAFGPWRIPHKGQTSLMLKYAQDHGLKIDYVVSEDTLSTTFPDLEYRIRQQRVDEVVFTSAFQLPRSQRELSRISSFLGDKTLHFVLEGLSGTGHALIPSVQQEIAFFDRAGVITDRAQIQTTPTL